MNSPVLLGELPWFVLRYLLHETPLLIRSYLKECVLRKIQNGDNVPLNAENHAIPIIWSTFIISIYVILLQDHKRIGL